MNISLLMENDVKTAKGDFSTVAPRILNEKANLIEELSDIELEERRLYQERDDLVNRLNMLKIKKKEAQVKLANNDELSKYWVINSTTLIA